MSEKTTAELIKNACAKLNGVGYSPNSAEVVIPDILLILRRLDREKADKTGHTGEQPETPTSPEIEAERAHFEKFLGPIPKPPSSPEVTRIYKCSCGGDMHGWRHPVNGGDVQLRCVRCGLLKPMPAAPEQPIPSPTAREIAERMVQREPSDSNRILIIDPRTNSHVRIVPTDWQRQPAIAVIINYITAAIELGQKQSADAETRARMQELKFTLDTIRTCNFKETVDRLHNRLAELEAKPEGSET